MTRGKLITRLLVMACCFGLMSGAHAAFVAYNDLVYPSSGGDPATNVQINYYTIGGVYSGEGFIINNEGSSGLLTDYNTHLETDVSVEITHTGTELWKMWYYSGGFWYGGWNALEGTPAYDAFAVWGGWHGVETRGVFYPVTDSGMEVTFAFAGLNVGSEYELVMYAGWAKDAAVDSGPLTLRIEGANGCTNQASGGPGVLMTDPVTTIMYTERNGFIEADIASWIVTPAGDGTFQLVASHPVGGGGAFAPQVFRLTEIEGSIIVPEPGAMGLIGLALLAVRKRRS